MKNKRKVLVISLIAALLAICALGTSAYFTDRGTAKNIITTGGVKIDLIETAAIDDVNVLMGTNSDEGSMFVQPMPVADYEALVCSVYTDWCDRFLAMYPATNEQEAYYSLSDIFRDGSFAWPYSSCYSQIIAERF